MNRGGSWNNNANNCRVADRDYANPGYASRFGLGFRAVLPSAHLACRIAAC